MGNECTDEVYKTYIVKDCQDKRLNDIAWWERKDKKQIIQEALDMYLASKKDVPVKSNVKVA
jgi:hypothetical protein